MTNYNYYYIGNTFGVWTGGFACRGEKVALLCCLATRGHHSCCSYQWSCNDEILKDESYAIIFVTSCGSYTCVITTISEKKHSFSFEVQGNALHFCTLCCDKKFIIILETGRPCCSLIIMSPHTSIPKKAS